MNKGTALMAMLAALQTTGQMPSDRFHGGQLKGDNSRPSTLTEKEAKERRKKNRAEKKARRKNRKH